MLFDKDILRITKRIFIVKWRFKLYYRYLKENLPFILESLEKPFKDEYDYYLLDCNDKEFLVYCFRKTTLSKARLKTLFRFIYSAKAVASEYYHVYNDRLPIYQKEEFEQLIREGLFILLPIIKKYFEAKFLLRYKYNESFK